MSDTVEHLIDWAPVGATLNLFGVDAGGKVGRMLDGEQPGNTIVNEKIVTQENSIEAQSAQRRLARLSRYFTSPSGVMDTPTGSQGIF